MKGPPPQGQAQGGQGVKGPPPQGQGGPKGTRPSHKEAINELGSSLSEETRTEMLSTVAEMQEAGEDDEAIKSYVDQTLTDNGVDLSERQSGFLLNIQG